MRRLEHTAPAPRGEQAGRSLTIALAGNPNCGKTTLFNRLTGANQRVGNFSGVTVTRKEGTLHHKGWTLHLIDLPGTYSLSSQTPDERVARDYILDERPDLILNVLDAGNLERNLFLTTQLIEMGRPRVYALNMIDDARNRGLAIDTPGFARLLGGPVIETVGRSGEGVERLLDTLVAAAEEGCRAQQRSVPYDEHLEAAIDRVQEAVVRHHPAYVTAPEARWIAVKALEGDANIVARGGTELAAVAAESRIRVERQHGDDIGILFADGRYGFIAGLMRETVSTGGEGAGRRDLTARIDDLLLHRLFGIPILLALVWLMFQATFTLGQYPMDWIDAGVGALSAFARSALPAGLLRPLLVDGVIGGVGGVIIFLPNILLLFLFISLFETTGYMARAAFLMDRLMHAIGLHGKAFIPLLMGFGCNVPAIMATRTIEQPRDRLVTILINPFMSCSARLPVYVLFAGAFFPHYPGTVVFAMHLLGVLVAMGAALLFKRTLFRGLSDPFVMELPPYRLPTLRSVLLHMWQKGAEFLKKMGGIILVGSILIWFLQAFPQNVPLSHDYGAERAAIVQQQPAGPARDQALARLANDRAAEEQSQRYLGRIGHAVEPVFAPLGFDWRASIALLTGFVAKEVVVSTFGVLYHVGKGEAGGSLRQAMAGSMPPHVALGFMVFTLLYVPCLATVAAIRRETASWGWTAFSVVFGLVVAWLLAFAVVHIGGMLS